MITSARAAILLPALLLLGARAASAEAEALRPGSARARMFLYHDNSGLDVTTAAIEAEQRLGPRWSLTAQALVDHISLARKAFDPGDPNAGSQASGHMHPGHLDAVTSASATISGGESEAKTRYEGIAGATFNGSLGTAPAALTALARVSSEVDYFSVGAQLRGSIELFERNTTITAFAGASRDRVTPLKIPPGQDDGWPATSRAIKLGALLSQILSSRVVGYMGVAATFQRGQLANPYRRAIVVTTLFPEAVPDSRSRYTGYAGLSISLLPDTALHLAQGVYHDSWGVNALIPEAALAQQIGRRATASVRYRFYVQSAASFYRPSYPDLQTLMSGDFRVGSIRDHAVGATVDVLLVEGRAGALALTLSYDLAHTRYLQIASDVTAHVGNLGIEGRY